MNKAFEMFVNFCVVIVLLFLITGISAGALENKPFAPGPALAFILRLTGRIELATDLAAGRKEPSDRPFTGLIQDRAADIQKETDNFVEKLPKTEDGKVETRALNCPQGAYAANVPQVSADKIGLAQGQSLRFLWDVQKIWGNPHCVARKEWRYFFDNGKVAIATESGGKVNVKIVGINF
jgi:hypothetical protein